MATVFPGGIDTFSTKVDRGLIYHNYFNDLQDSVVALENYARLGGGNIFNVVTDFGASGGGVGDDAPAIRLATAAALAAGGGTVYFPPGTYLIDSYLTAPVSGTTYGFSVGYSQGVTLHGAGRSSIIKQGGSFTGGALVGFGKEGNANTYFSATQYAFNSAVRGANSITTTAAADAGNFAAGDVIWINNNNSGDYTAHEINVVTGANASTGVLSLRYHLSKDFSGTRRVANVTSVTARDIGFENLCFQHSTAQALVGSQALGMRIQDCTFEGTGANAMQINAVRDLLIDGNNIGWYGAAVGNGVDPSRCSMDVRITHNVIRSNGNCVGAVEGAANWVIAHNELYTMGTLVASCVEISGSYHISISDNSIYFTAFNANYQAINTAANGDSLGVSVTYNKIFVNGTAGYAVGCNSSNTVIANNYIVNSVGSGITVTEAGASVIGNTILLASAGVNGITIGATGHSARVIGNSMYSSTRASFGISVVDNGAQTASPIIVGNKIEKFTYGIVVADAADDSTILIDDNLIVDCTNNYSPITLENGVHNGKLFLTDGVTAPAAIVGLAQVFVDVADGDFKIIYGDGVTKVIAADTETMPVFGIALFGLSQFTMTTSLKDIRERVGLSGFLADTTISAASALGSTTTLIDTSLKQPDDYFNYGSILILTGANAGQVRYITDWDQATSTFTFDRALAAAVASGVQYEIHRLSHPYDVNNAINEAIRSAGSRWCRYIEDATLTLDSNIYTYSLGALAVEVDPILGIDHVLYDTGLTGTGYPYGDISPSFRLLRNNAGTLTLQFQNTPPRNAATARLLYRVRPAQLQSDTDLLAPQDETFYNYVCAKATAVLFRARALNAPDKGWADNAKEMEQMAEGFFDLEKPQAPSKPIVNQQLMWGEGYRFNNGGWW